MAVPSKSWTAIIDSQIDPDSPIDVTLMTSIRDNLVNLQEWLGYGFIPAQGHNHDGVNSSAIPIGANSLRNGSFESDMSGWTFTAYTGGSSAINTAAATDGIKCLAITSTVLANGGGYALTDEYETVGANVLYAVRGKVKASAINISSSVDVIWYDSAKSQISVSNIYTSTATPTTDTNFTAEVIAPTTARYKRLKVTGGVPSSGTATGTIYFDGLLSIRSYSGEVGTVVYTAGSVAPNGYLKCNGAAISRTAYATLYAVIGTTYGVGDGSTTFNLPELRGEFIRSLADGRAVDTGRVLGSYQASDNLSHSHTKNYYGYGMGSNNVLSVDAILADSGYFTGSWSTNSTGGSESRPRNVALLAIIKY